MCLLAYVNNNVPVSHRLMNQRSLGPPGTTSFAGPLACLPARSLAHSLLTGFFRASFDFFSSISFDQERLNHRSSLDAVAVPVYHLEKPLFA